MIAILPLGVCIRAPTRDDAGALADLINACALAVGDVPDRTASAVLSDWDSPRFNLARDAWIAEDTSGRVVGYEEGLTSADATLIELDGYVHPDALGQGIGTYLVRTAEAWAQARVTEPVTVRATVDGASTHAHQLFTGEGFEPVRQFWRMEIELREPPPAPHWPAGLGVRTVVPGRDDRRLYAAVEAAFADHWGHVPVSYEDWAHRHHGVDPTLCFLAVAGEEIAGAAMCITRLESGWVRNLSVRRPWRRQGLGLALLHHAFGAFYQRGIPVVGLGVDSQNPTGATRLYERAGMHVRVRYDTFEKTLYPLAQSPS